MPQNGPPARQPRVVLITGAPGSGKTTLGTEISRALQIPFIARDDVRRGLYFTAGGWSASPEAVPTRSESVETFLRMVETTAALGVSLVAEYVVGRDRDDEFDRMRAVADCRVIVTEAERALQRFEARHRGDRLVNRRPVLDVLGYETVDEHTADAVERMRSVAMGMRTQFDVPLLVVRTDDGYVPDMEEILDFVTEFGPAG